MVNVAVVVSDPVHGVLFYPVQVALTLKLEGHNVWAICNTLGREQSAGLKQSLLDAGVTLIDVPELNYSAGFRSLFRAVALRQRNPHTLPDFDKVISTGPFVTVQLRLAKFKGFFVTIIHAMGHDGNSHIKPFLGSVLLNFFSDRVVALCGSEKKRLLGLGISKQKIKVIHNPVCIEDMRSINFNTSDDPLVKNTLVRMKRCRAIACLASFQPRKQQLRLLSVFKRVSKNFPNTILVLAGDGPQLSQCRRFVDENDLTERVIFTGRVSTTDAFSIMNHASLIVHCSNRETFGYSMIEPIVLGVPCLLSRVGIGHELVGLDNVDVFDPDDFEVLYELIHKNFSAPHKKNNLSEKNRDFIERKFDIKHICRALVNA